MMGGAKKKSYPQYRNNNGNPSLRDDLDTNDCIPSLPCHSIPITSIEEFIDPRTGRVSCPICQASFLLEDILAHGQPEPKYSPFDDQRGNGTNKTNVAHQYQLSKFKNVNLESSNQSHKKVKSNENYSSVLKEITPTHRSTYAHPHQPEFHPAASQSSNAEQPVPHKKFNAGTQSVGRGRGRSDVNNVPGRSQNEMYPKQVKSNENYNSVLDEMTSTHRSTYALPHQPEFHPAAEQPVPHQNFNAGTQSVGRGRGRSDVNNLPGRSQNEMYPQHFQRHGDTSRFYDSPNTEHMAAHDKFDSGMKWRKKEDTVASDFDNESKWREHTNVYKPPNHATTTTTKEDTMAREFDNESKWRENTNVYKPPNHAKVHFAPTNNDFHAQQNRNKENEHNKDENYANRRYAFDSNRYENSQLKLQEQDVRFERPDFGRAQNYQRTMGANQPEKDFDHPYSMRELERDFHSNLKDYSSKSPPGQLPQYLSKKTAQKEGIDCHYCYNCEKFFIPGTTNAHTSHRYDNMKHYLNKMRTETYDKKYQTMDNFFNNKKELNNTNSLLKVAHDIQPEMDTILNKCSNNIMNVSPIADKLYEKLTDFIPMMYTNVVEARKDSEHIKNLETEVLNLSLDSQKIPQALLSVWIKSSLGMMLATQQKETYIKCSNHQSALVRLEGDQIKLHCLTKNIPLKEAHIIPNFFMPFMESEGTKAFMELSRNNENLGTITIRQLGCNNFWSKQFLAMCSGIMGQSFLNVPFHRVSWAGKSGHHLWGGDYSRRDGSGGKRVLTGGSYSMEPVSHPVVPGLIASRFGIDDFSTIFRIYLEGSDHLEDHAFGMVEDGRQILDYVGGLTDITEVKISQVGLIFSISN